MKIRILGLWLASFLLFSSITAFAQEEETKDLSVWEKNRLEYQQKREEFFEHRHKRANEYKSRIGNNKYRQKARKFYGRQEGIYDHEIVEQRENGKNRENK